MNGDLNYCDGCLKSEIENIVKGESKELIPMTKTDEGIFCNECLDNPMTPCEACSNHTGIDMESKDEQQFHNSVLGDRTEVIKCDSCNYEGNIDTYEATASLYSDIRCPKCGSTNNKHNQVGK